MERSPQSDGDSQEGIPEVFRKALIGRFPLFDQLATDGALSGPGYDFECALWSDHPDLLDWLAPNLKTALSLWAVASNAETDWVMRGALRTLQDWHNSAKEREALSWNSLHSGDGVAVIGKTFEFSFNGWDFQTVTSEEYRRALQTKLKDEFARYERETRDLAELRGLIRARRTMSLANLEWFVLYQFVGLSFKEIADLNAD